MNQEIRRNYDNILAITIHYWDKSGIMFIDKNQLDSKFKHFTKNLNNYEPRNLILDNLFVEKVSDKFIELLKF